MPKPPNPAGRKGRPISLHGLTPEQAIGAFLKIKPEDVKKIKAATDPNKGKKRKAK